MQAKLLAFYPNMKGLLLVGFFFCGQATFRYESLVVGRRTERGLGMSAVYSLEFLFLYIDYGIEDEEKLKHLCSGRVQKRLPL